MTTIIRAAAASDFLALVPQLAGYRPTRSIVLVPFHGTRTMGVLRADLPDPAAADPDATERAAATLIGMVCRLPEADGVALIVYADAPFAADDGIVHAPLIAALRSRADACGLSLADALCVASDGWGSYLDPECPPGGRPLGEIAHTLDDVPEEMRHVESDQIAGSALPRIDRAERTRVAGAHRELAAAIRALVRTRSTPGTDAAIGELSPLAIAAVDALEDLPALFEDALDWNAEDLRPFDAAALIWCLDRPAVRDIALAQWALGEEAGDMAIAAQLMWEAGEDYPEEFAQHMWGEGPRPDVHRLHAALALVRRLCACAPTSQRPGALATAAWLAWALGRSTHAGWYATRALELEPAHGLAQIVRAMADAGHLPDWVFTGRAE